MPKPSCKYREYDLFCEDLSLLPELPQVVINTINQYSFCIAEEDLEFKAALLDSTVLLPDGVGIVVAVKTLTHQNIKKISGADCHAYLLAKLNATFGSVFYLGSSDQTLQKIKSQLAVQYPNIICNYYSPPYKANFSEADNLAMIEAVNACSPDVLFVGMTAPKQEKWVHMHKGSIHAKVICSIGAVFDFYAGTVKRPAKVFVDLKLEWFVRLIKEPKRMWKRYLYYGPIFVFVLLKDKISADISTNHTPSLLK